MDQGPRGDEMICDGLSVSEELLALNRGGWVEGQVRVMPTERSNDSLDMRRHNPKTQG